VFTLTIPIQNSFGIARQSNETGGGKKKLKQEKKK
jgi:hypothetical protein